MGNREWNGNKRRKNIRARERTQGGGNIIASWYPSKRAWGKIEDDRVGHQELLVTRSNKRSVDEYNACQRYKNWSEAPAGKLMPNAIPEKPWSHILADFITKLPLAQEYDAILVVCDWFSKMAHFIATTEKTSAEGLAKLFWDYVWKLHRLPESIILDRECSLQQK